MTNIDIKLTESIIIFILLVFSTNWLKYRKIISENSKNLFTRLIIDYTLPCLIFLNLAKTEFNFHNLEYAGILIIVEIFILIIAIFISKLLNFNSGRIGAIALVSTFSSSALLGFPLIKMIFSNNPKILSTTIIISEFGVGIPLFTVGILTAIYFGSKKDTRILGELLNYLKSPIFISIILGILISFVDFNNQAYIYVTIEKFLNIIGSPIELMTAIVVGLILKPIHFRSLIKPIIIVITLKLLFQPIMADYILTFFQYEDINRHILLILSALPSASLAVVISDKYGCDSKLASNLLIASFVIGAITLPIVFTLTY